MGSLLVFGGEVSKFEGKVALETVKVGKETLIKKGDLITKAQSLLIDEYEIESV